MKEKKNSNVLQASRSACPYSYQWVRDDGPYTLIPVGPQEELVKILIDTGVYSVLTQDAKKLCVRHRWQRVKITGANRASVDCQTSKVNLWLLSEKHMLAAHFFDHHENIMGFDVLNGGTWHLLCNSVGSFSSNLTPCPGRNRESPACVFCTAPAITV